MVCHWGREGNAARCVGTDLSLSIWVEAGGSRVQAHPQLHRKFKASPGYKKPTLKQKGGWAKQNIYTAPSKAQSTLQKREWEERMSQKKVNS